MATEIDALIKGIEKRPYLLQSLVKTRPTALALRKGWQEVTDEVNAKGEGFTKRDARSLIQKWSDMKSRIKCTLVSLARKLNVNSEGTVVKNLEDLVNSKNLLRDFEREVVSLVSKYSNEFLVTLHPDKTTNQTDAPIVSLPTISATGNPFLQVSNVTTLTNQPTVGQFVFIPKQVQVQPTVLKTNQQNSRTSAVEMNAKDVEHGETSHTRDEDSILPEENEEEEVSDDFDVIDRLLGQQDGIHEAIRELNQLQREVMSQNQNFQRQVLSLLRQRNDIELAKLKLQAQQSGVDIAVISEEPNMMTLL